MEAIHELIASAKEYIENGKTEQALERYNDAFNVLVEQAAAFARAETGDLTDEAELRAIAPLLLSYSKEYLAQDLTAATILNAMGLLFAELGDYENAKQKFEESIDYIPANMDYADPVQNLEDINARVIKNAELESVDEE